MEVRAKLRAGVAVVLAIAAGCGQGDAAPPSPAAATTVPIVSIASPSTAASVSPAMSASIATSASAAASSPPVDDHLVSTSRLIAWIYETPKLDAPHAGYLRAGFVAHWARELDADAKGTIKGECRRWLELRDGGFVCEGHEGVTTDMNDATVAAAAKYRPTLQTPLPYGYATSYGSPLYTHVPNADEQRAAEGDVAAYMHQRAVERAKLGDKAPPETAIPLTPEPDFLLNRAQAPNVVGWPIPKGAATTGTAWPSMRLSMLAAFESDGRDFYLTTEHFIVPADRFRAARLCDFHGVELAAADQPGAHLPMVWSRWRPVPIYALPSEKDGHAEKTSDVLPVQGWGAIDGHETIVDGVRYLAFTTPPTSIATPSTSARYAVRASDVTRLDALKKPSDVEGDDAWIDVSLSRQTLVLYRGTTPVFATLVSTGADGAGDVATTRSTPRGQFRIYSKHVGYRMSADEHPPWKEGDTPDPHYRIDDVPWAEYFEGGYALHAAFWHDAFGQPKSHGCVNLSPRDALYLFGKTEPALPDGWYGVYSGRAGRGRGSVVVVREW